MNTIRLTVAQAIVKYLTVQYTERDGEQQRFFAGMFGIFGHGNVTGIGQALEEVGDDLTFYRPQNEQAMVHTAAAYTKMKNRLQTFACTSSVGPGATNMITGRRWRPSTGYRCCCCPATPSPTASRTRCCSNSSTR